MHLGGVEAHAPLLTISPDGQLLYKIVSVENLLRSSSVTTFTLTASNRYKDSPGADPHDGRQLPKDPTMAALKFSTHLA